MIRRVLATTAITALAVGGFITPASAALPEPSPAKVRTLEAQLRLNALGLEKPLAADGTYGPRTDGALDMWRGAPGNHVTDADLKRLREATTGRWTMRVFKSEQKTRVSYNGIPVGYFTSGTASGKYYRARNGSVHRATTPNGDFTITREIPGWRESSSVEGHLFEPHYFLRGWAFHGSTNPSGRSHGCVRLSLTAAGALDAIFVPGDRIVIEGDDPAAPASGPGSKLQPGT